MVISGRPGGGGRENPVGEPDGAESFHHGRVLPACFGLGGRAGMAVDDEGWDAVGTEEDRGRQTREAGTDHQNGRLVDSHGSTFSIRCIKYSDESKDSHA